MTYTSTCAQTRAVGPSELRWTPRYQLTRQCYVLQFVSLFSCRKLYSSVYPLLGLSLDKQATPLQHKFPCQHASLLSVIPEHILPLFMLLCPLVQPSVCSPPNTICDHFKRTLLFFYHVYMSLVLYFVPLLL